MTYTPILATLGYILSDDGRCVLMIHRNARPGDLHLGKFNGLGGKVEPEEDIGSCMIREIREEAGIEVQAMTLRATISWPGFGRNGEDWFGFIFLITKWTGQPALKNHEGDLEWVELEALLAGKVPLWGGDHFFIPMIFDNNPETFHGVMPYADGKPARWTYYRNNSLL